MTIIEQHTSTSVGYQTEDFAENLSQSFWSAAADSETYGALSFDRSVNWLLDLYQSTSDQGLRLLIAEVLDDVRTLGPVEGEFEDVVLGALASVEIAIEIAGTSR